jgi:NADH dehydrogenase
MTDTATNETHIPHVVTLGGGFGVILLYKKLAPLIRRGRVQLTIIDRNNYTCFHGIVPAVLTGKIQPGNVLNSLRTIYPRAQFRNAEIEKIDLEKKEILYSRALDGKQFTVNYDHLVFNVGSMINLKLFPGMAEHTLRLKSFQDILAARHHIITMLELADIEQDPVEQQRLINFVVAGGNYAGVEVASELADSLPQIARQRFPNIPVEKMRVTIVHSGEKLLPEMGRMYPRLQAYAMRALQDLPNLRVVTQSRVASATPEEALLTNGERIPTRTIIACAGTTSSPLLDLVPFARTEEGRLEMDEFCRVKGQEHIWGAGDCAGVPRRDGSPAPALAIWALMTGSRAGANIRAVIEGRKLKRFRFSGIGDAATVGKNRAAAHVRGFPLTGVIGFVAWFSVVLMYIPAWEKKVRLLIDWLLLPLFGRDVINMNVQKPVGLMPVHYEPGQDIVRQGDVGQSLYIIRSGEVEVRKDGADGAAAVVATLGAGQHFGEVAVFRRVRRTATVRAKTRVELLHVRREAALALSESKAEIGATLAPPADRG